MAVVIIHHKFLSAFLATMLNRLAGVTFFSLFSFLLLQNKRKIGT